MNNYIIETKQLSKDFSGEAAVNQLSIQVRKNEIYGFLGPNGAGKSTAMKMLLGLLQPTHGSIRLFDKNFDSNQIALLSSVGSLIEEPSYYANLTGYENLEIIQRLLKLPKENIDKVLKIVKLYEQKDKLVKNYSLGMKQRLGIALAIIKFPKLLILDEPTNGLDPAGIQEIRELIKSLPQKYDMTVIISSHILSEIEQMATTVGIINKGKLLFEGQLTELEEDEKYLFETSDDALAEQLLMRKGFELEENQSIVLKDYNKTNIAAAVKVLVANDIDIYQVRMVRKSLEEVFLDMTGREGGVL
ncbi:ABC transporter ATP-binding protein [Streptococcus mutans]|jgi:putative bacitracin ABC transporter, ATP-binding protein BcrA|uniref:ABC transporter, ATP-binding protein n=1 Tax=Streptococcus mutans SM6 TaxID=857119 RepID=A0A829BKK8_STRMG|nr:ATP-binding cassette domain-containing protein [Streptococcus mutans]EMB97544.1 ABC transporter, ATP-binding protein [Streptococcus mutans M21]EMC13669.1 ABC transporter, ATP-binding protein [Streptococcus mutans M2A]EMC25580.1 ABC transporter, ATP-binding protein [Streptococcus mutans SM6]EMC46788.1 ABC transporter, ATP-binding protein [Streptococcus mutans 24]EMP62579.1 putative bacitracin transport ATP-binding protein BcrA [Streptococcus mutans KK23]